MEPTPPPISQASAKMPPIAPPITEQPQFAQYPRGYQHPQVYGSYEKLKALGDAYFGTTKAFLIFLAIILVGFSIALAMHNSDASGAIFIATYFIALIVFVGMSIQCAISLGVASSWSKGISIFLGIVCGFTGIIGLIIIQTICGSEIQGYGIRQKFLGGIPKREYRALLEEYRVREGIPA